MIKTGTIKNQKASKERWLKVSPEERTKKMSAVAKLRWAKASPAQKKEQALKMVAGRKVKSKK